MKEWFKPKLKNKVGRPKLAKKTAVKIAKTEALMAFILCIIIIFSGMSVLTGKTPMELLSFGSAAKAKGSISAEGEISPEYKLTCNGINYGVYKIRYYSTGTVTKNTLTITVDGKKYPNYSYHPDPEWIKSPTFRYEVSALSKFMSNNNYEDIEDIYLTINRCKTKLNYDKTKKADRIIVFTSINSKQYSESTTIKYSADILGNYLPEKIYEITHPYLAPLNIDNVAPTVSRIFVTMLNDLYGSLYIEGNDNVSGGAWGEKNNLKVNLSLYEYGSKVKILEKNGFLIKTYTQGLSETKLTTTIAFQTDNGEYVLKNNKKYSVDVKAIDTAENVSTTHRYNFIVDSKGTAYEYKPNNTTTTRPATTTTTTVTTTTATPPALVISKTIGNVKLTMNVSHKSPVPYNTMVRVESLFKYISLPSKGGDQYYKRFYSYYILSDNKKLEWSKTECLKIDEDYDRIVPLLYVRTPKVFGKWRVYKDSSCSVSVGYANTPVYSSIK